MKRTLLISIIGFIILIVISIFLQYYLEKSSDKLLIELNNLRVLVNENKIYESVMINEKLNQKWEETKSKWSALIDHQELDNIEEVMHRIEILIGEDEEKAELLSELNKLKFYFEHVPVREKFAIENIL